jgi:hypothetical protein
VRHPHFHTLAHTHTQSTEHAEAAYCMHAHTRNVCLAPCSMRHPQCDPSVCIHSNCAIIHLHLNLIIVMI